MDAKVDAYPYLDAPDPPRNPEIGKVKTRLAKTIGDLAALKVYRKLRTDAMS